MASPVDETSDEQTGGRAIESSALPAGGSDGKAKAGITDAPLAIVVSCKEGSEFDAGLTCQKYVGGGTAIEIWYKDYFITHDRTHGENQETFRELLGIPDDQSAVAVLLVGMEDTSLEADAVTAATIRNAAEEIVTKVTP